MSARLSESGRIEWEDDVEQQERTVAKYNTFIIASFSLAGISLCGDIILLVTKNKDKNKDQK